MLAWSLACAQDPAPPPDWQQQADAAPFPMDRITVPSWRLAGGPHVRAAFRTVVAEAGEAAVRVRCDGRNAALGGIVGPDGWVLTKASRLTGNITCRLRDGRELDARLVGVSRDYDVAMLKIDAKRLPALHFENSHAPPVGAWVATVGLSRDPVAVGVVSVAPRKIPHRAGILGVQLDDSNDQALVVRVFPHTGAASAGLLVNDVLLTVDDQPTPTRDELIRVIRSFSPGDQVTLQVQRGDQTLNMEATLTGDLPGRRLNRSQFQNHLGGRLSERRFGFPNALQHDAVVRPIDCGGPIVNLDGQIVGFNIARAGRTETYAIPATSLTKLLYELMSGNLPPESEKPTATPAAEQKEQADTPDNAPSPSGETP